MVLKHFRNYLSLIKFSHTVFAMPFAVIGFFLAINASETGMDYRLLVLVVLCMVFARSAAMAFNRIVDREFDKKNPRTRNREIPSGIIKIRWAWVFVIVSCILFIAATWFINLLCFYLSPVALLVVLGYSYTKRFTSFSHFILGLGLSLAPIGAYIAVTGRFALTPLLYSGVVLLWVAGFDIIYALQDEDFDKKEKLKSIPAQWGRKNALIVSVIAHFFSVVFLVIAGVVQKAGLYFIVGAVLFVSLLVYQHIVVKPGDISRVNFSFAIINGWAAVLLAVFVVLDLFITNGMKL